MITKLTATCVILLATAFPSLASAESCGAGRSAQSPAVKILQRQLSALRSIQRARGCKPGDSGGGLFNPCREVSLKISDIQQELGATSAANNACKAGERAAATRAKTPQAIKVSAAASTRSQPDTDTPKRYVAPKRPSILRASFRWLLFSNTEFAIQAERRHGCRSHSMQDDLQDRRYGGLYQRPERRSR